MGDGLYLFLNKCILFTQTILTFQSLRGGYIATILWIFFLSMESFQRLI
jgi:hypothetical protein